MSRAGTHLDGMRHNPVGDWTIGDVARMVREHVVQIEPVPSSEGGGRTGRVPDPPGCLPDGDDVESLKAHVADAIETWISAARCLGRPVPRPADLQRRRA